MIEVERVTISAGDFRISDVSFTVPTGTYGVLMGRTGSGKTTLLEAVCGLKSVTSGNIRLGGRNVTTLYPAERGIGYVPQDGALFQTMTVRAHLEFALRIRKWKRDQTRQRVDQLAELVGVRHLLGRKPQGLSGGESQRVALGRALAFHPKYLCLDEPLSALDEESRESMCQLLKRVQRETGVTALHVTHNRQEAARLADRMLEVVDGQVIVADWQSI